jgi:hypothetical protein
MIYHNSPYDMAKVLVQYIRCDKRVQSEILANYESSPCINAIAELRASHERRITRHSTGYDNTVVWMDKRYENDMDKANRAFVRALTNARIAA